MAASASQSSGITGVSHHALPLDAVDAAVLELPFHLGIDLGYSYEDHISFSSLVVHSFSLLADLKLGSRFGG